MARRAATAPARLAALSGPAATLRNWLYPPRMSLPGGWELIIVLILMLALVGFAIWRLGPRR